MMKTYLKESAAIYKMNYRICIRFSRIALNEKLMILMNLFSMSN